MSNLLRIVFDPDLTPPGVPSITAATPVSQTRIDITWTAITDNAGGVGLAGYDIEIDGSVVPTGVQTSYSATGFTAGTSHTFRVRSRDLATPANISAFSAQVQATTIAAPVTFNPTYPRLGSYAIGGQQNYHSATVMAALAKRHVNIISHYPGWQNSKGTTLAAVTQSIKSTSTIGTKIFVYVITSSLYKVAANVGQAYWEPYQRLVANKEFGYSNGLAETGVLTSAADATQDQTNYRLTGKVVGGKRWYQYIIDWSIGVSRDGVAASNGTTALTAAANPNLDGFFIDNVFSKERTAADYDRNGSPDNIDSVADMQATQNAHVAAISYLRSVWPASTVLVNSADWREYETAYGFGAFSGAPLNQKVEGGAIESLEQYEPLAFSSLMSAIKTQMDAYITPKLGVMGWKLASLTDYQMMRYGLGVSLLTDAYYYPLVSTYRSEDLPSLWYDEFDFNLGPAIDPVQTVARYQVGTLGEGVWRRDFANGIVLVGARRASGATTAYSPVSLGGTFYRLVGTQAPTINSGAAATTINISPRDAIVLARLPQVGSGVFPLTVSSNGRYLQDNTGAPFLIHGDTPWSLAVQLTRAQITTYLDDRASKGFNTVLFNAVEHHFSDNSPAYRNREGNDPFVPMSNFGAPNEAYWQLVDYIVVACLARGMVAIINPAYLGFGGGAEGWMSEVTAETAADLQTYGVFLANRYGTYGNVIWSMGGDYAGTSVERAKQWNIVTGIRSIDTDALITAHGARTESAYSQWSSFRGSGFNLNCIYSNGVEYTFAATEYARSPAMPFFEFEGYYDDARTGSPPASVADCRRQAYASILSGACGHMFGNAPVWDFGSSAGSGGGVTASLTNLSTTATNQMAYVKALFTAFSWQNLQPVTNTSLVSTSLGSGTTRIIPARSSDGSFAMVWTTGSNFTVNLNSLTINSIRARWYNPTDGTYAAIGTYSNLGTQAFTAPGERVLVLDQSPATGGGTFFSGFSLESGSPNPTDGATVTFLSATNAFGPKENGEKALEIWEPTKGNTLLSAESRNGTGWPTSLGASAPRYGSIVTTSPLPPNATSVWQVMYTGAGNNGFWGPLPHNTNGSNIQIRRTWRVNFNGQQAFARPVTDGWNLKNDRVWDTGFNHDAVGGYADNEINGNPRYIFEGTASVPADGGSAGYGLATDVWMPEHTFLRQSATPGANGNMTIFQFGRRRVNYSQPTRTGTGSLATFFGQVFGPQRERINADPTWYQRCADYVHDDSFCAIEITDQPPPGNDASTSNWETEWCVPVEWASNGGRVRFRIRKGVYSLANKYIRIRKTDMSLVYVFQFPSTA